MKLSVVMPVYNEQDTLEERGAHVSVADDRPIPGVQFGYALNLSVCNGCRKCAEACHEETDSIRCEKNLESQPQVAAS